MPLIAKDVLKRVNNAASRLLAVFLSSTLIKEYYRDEKGATAMEYCLMVAGIGLSIILVMFAIGDEIYNVFSTIQTRMAGRQP